ncbi:MAG: hypothetical protein F6K10_10885, partial [Moorea sp. SIO2B7]|nr:hypothetical protein [Moorena sp. SIO2B7]
MSNASTNSIFFLPDLKGTYFNLNPEPLNAGNSFTIDYDISNLGTAAAGAFDVSFYLSSNDFISTGDYFLGTTTISGLTAGSTGLYNNSFTLPGINDAFWTGDGTYYVGMIVDSGNTVTESNEGNNSNVGFLDDYDDVFVTTQYADLSGSYFNILQEPLNAGNSFTIDYDISNLGTAAAGAFDVSFYLSSNDFISTGDYFLGTTTISGLTAGSTGLYNNSFTLPGINDAFWTGDGTYYVGMIVDSGNTVTESNEGNNSNVGFLDDYDDV